MKKKRSGKNQFPDDLMIRFWNKVQKTNSCWLWTGASRGRTGDQYGVFRINTKAVSAHRASYILFKGPVNGFHVLHKCDVKLCVNPDHLFIGTNKDNMEDKVSKGKSGRKSHCKRGHALSGENVHIHFRIRRGHKTEERICRACQRIIRKVQYDKDPIARYRRKGLPTPTGSKYYNGDDKTQP